MGRGGDNSARDRRTLAFLLHLVPPASPTSTEPCAVDGAFASSGPAGNLGCIFHIHTYPTREGYAGTVIPPQHPGLLR